MTNLTAYKQNKLIEQVQTLESINHEIAELKRVKEEIEAWIINTLEHDHDGSKSYKVDTYKVTVRTETIASLDKGVYQDLKQILIDNDCELVRESIKYDVVKAVLRKQDTLPAEVQDAIRQMITTKPAKPAVTIGAAS